MKVHAYWSGKTLQLNTVADSFTKVGHMVNMCSINSIYIFYDKKISIYHEKIYFFYQRLLLY